MALDTYSDLVAEISDFAARTDAEFSANVPTFIRLAEFRMWNGNAAEGSDAVRSAYNEKTGTLAVTSGVATLPSDFIAARAINVTDGLCELKYMEPRDYDLRIANGVYGDPAFYTIKGRQFVTSPNYTGNISLLYWFKPDALTETNTTNEVFAALPELYLLGAMIEAHEWISDDGEAAKALNKYNGAVVGVNTTARSTRYGLEPLAPRFRKVV